MKKKTLVSRFIRNAGLGNQLFEWAAGHAMAKRLGMNFECMWEPSIHREFGLGVFGIKPIPYDPNLEPVCPHLSQGTRRATAAIGAVVKTYDGDPVVIRSPFQSEVCFEGFEDEIREIYRLDPLPPAVPSGRTPVALQVRRGDYLKYKHLGITHMGYFQDAMDMVRQRIDKPQFVVVSDDPVWCAGAFGKIPDTTVLPDQTAVEALRTMVSCEAHIISNSTLAWWGAWLANKETVVAPCPWHHGGERYGEWAPVPDRWLTASTRMRETFVPDPPPDLDRAIVIPWRQESAKWEELRFVLRSIDRFFEDRQCPIFILGNRRPGWIPLSHSRVRYLDRWSYQEALVTGVQLADKVAWFNDDTVLLKPTTWADLEQPYHMGPVTIPFIHRMTGTTNTWRDGMLRVIEDMKVVDGVAEPLLFSTHTPYVFERTKALAVLRAYGFWHKMPFEMAYGNRHWREQALPLGDVLTHQVPFADSRYLNHTDKLLTPELKEALKALLPARASWEAIPPVNI